MTARVVTTALAIACAASVSGAAAQTVVSAGRGAAGVMVHNMDRLIESVADDDVPTIVDAPFTAEATTEFIQILSDGNRIEKRYSTSLARDSKGRTRREQEVALIGPLAVFEPGAAGGPGRARVDTDASGQPPRFVTIADPVAGATYTLDARAKVAHRGNLPGGGGRGRGANVVLRVPEVGLVGAGAAAWTASVAVASNAGPGHEPDAQQHKFFEAATAFAGVRVGNETTEKLGTAEIEGVTAEGTRTTMTIPAGAIGNQLPIEVVTERWYSPALQMAVRITRRDPRSGETLYRLTNLSRTEPPADLFVPPSDYQVWDMNNFRIQAFQGDATIKTK
jgi:hypothetical protein